MDLTELRSQIELLLPHSKLVDDLAGVLQSAENRIELDDASISVPREYDLIVISRSFRHTQFDVGFTPLRSTLALGGMSTSTGGEMRAGICFVTLHYDEHLKLITSDFDKELV